ncbi:hypothetical protein ACQPX6_09765 [Actinomycetospora sp. CA-101289]|uniref:hypothetical protein n=1 Tax=Actinomycetospora sp. CA-101289 TaxID=3239893 RepID=UPI003D95A708
MAATLAFNASIPTTTMSPRRWAWVVAAVELACGIVVAAYFVVLGLTAPDTSDRTMFDRAFPFALAVLGLALLGTMAWWSARRARTPPERVDDRGGFAGVERQRGPHAGTTRPLKGVGRRAGTGGRGRAVSAGAG